MWVAGFFALLLPLGIWLVQSGATSSNDEAKQAANGLTTLALSSLFFIAIGFGLMFGGVGTVSSLPELTRYVTYYTLPINNQNWGLFGLRGFWLDSLSEPVALQLCLTYLPLAISCAMLMANLLARQAGFVSLGFVAVVIAGLLFPVAGFWVWGGGWLATLGMNLNLGHGSVDISGFSTAALVAGGAGLAWLVFSPRRPKANLPELPPTYFPFRSLSGIVCMLVGAGATVAGNPLLGNVDERVAAVLLINTVVATSAGVLVALIYTVFTVRRPNLNSASRAALGALIATAAGGALLPTWTALLVGVCTGLLATLGLYVTNEVLGWQDDASIITTVLIPGILGLLITGLFANGSFGQGLNGVGTTSYLGVEKLGIVGLFSSAGAPGDTGQLTAQLVAAIIVPGFAFAVFTPVVWLLRRGAAVQPTVQVQPIYKENAQPELETRTPQTAQNSTILPSPATATMAQASTNVEPVAHPQASAISADNQPLQPAAELAVPATSTRNDTRSSFNAERKETLLERLRRARGVKPEPERTGQPRHVAYPNRVAGRRLSIRPMPKMDDKNPAENGKPAK